MIVLFLRPNLKEWKRRLRASKSHKSLYLSLTFPNGTRLYYFVSCVSRIHANERIKDRCNHWLPELFAKNAFFIWTLSVCIWAELAAISKGNMKACLSFHYQRVLWHFCSRMRRNQNFEKASHALILHSFFSPYIFQLWSFYFTVGLARGQLCWSRRSIVTNVCYLLLLFLMSRKIES